MKFLFRLLPTRKFQLISLPTTNLVPKLQDIHVLSIDKITGGNWFNAKNVSSYKRTQSNAVVNGETQPRNILNLSSEERRNFMNSFDTVLCDCDGVMWTPMQLPIPNAAKGIEYLREAGKKVVFVTNNSVRSPDDYLLKFEKTGLKVNFDEVVHPVTSIIKYLKKINFEGLVYCIATENFKNYLRNAGFSVTDGPNKILDETFEDLAKNIFDEAPVRAVVIDIDYNLSASKLIRAHLYLKHPDCILIGGAADMIIPFGESDIIGPGPYVKIVENSSKKNAVILGKPGKEMVEMFKEEYNAKNAKNILFIGDMLETDIGFGKMCGFQTLVVLSGATKIENIFQHENDKEIPDYYAESITDFVDFLNKD